MIRASVLLRVVAALALSYASGEAIPPPAIVIEDVAVVDIVHGRIEEPQTVFCADRRITAICDPGRVAIPPSALRVEGRGRYLMPGLTDMHVHLFNNSSHRPPNEWAFPLFIANGVTSVREMRTEPAQIAQVNRWRAQVTTGELVAPRILAAGIVAGLGSVEAARREVREAKAAGADFVKVFSERGEAQWRAVLDEAGMAKLPVCGHIPAGVGAREAAEAGQRTGEHLTQIYEACSSKEKRWLSSRAGLAGEALVSLRDRQEGEVLESFDQSICNASAAALAKTAQAQVPTLVLPYFEAHGAWMNFREDPRWRQLRADEQARWERVLPEEATGDHALAHRRWEVSRQIVQSLHSAGVTILAGTDTPMPLVYPGSSLHRELQLLVESGLSPADALRAATIGPAEFLGLSESSGSIAVGKTADLILLDGDPLNDIHNTERIRAVIYGGRLLNLDDLGSMQPSLAEVNGGRAF